MEPTVSVMDKLKGFMKSGEEFVRGIHNNSARHNPIEILKRLQREAFSDLMKLRDRQDKVERIISFYKSSKGSPFQEASTNLKGEVNVMGALLLEDDINHQNYETLDRAGIKMGVDSRFTFQTTIRQKDALVTEFVASQKDQGFLGDNLGGALSLAKVMYLGNFSDWFSAVAIPVGAQCKDVAISTNLPEQGRGFTDFSSFGPPFLSQHHGAAIGLMVRRSNIAAVLAEFVSGSTMQSGSIAVKRCFSTFGQVILQVSEGTKLTLLGLHQMPKSLSQKSRFGVLTIPTGILKRNKHIDLSVEESSSPSLVGNREENISGGSIALMLESELDESTRVKGWVEMKKSNPKYLQWAISMSDTPENELGWGFSVGGTFQGPSTWDLFQMEAFLKFDFGKRFSLQPGLVYVMDGKTRIPALMFRSSWSL